jgi:hypothetical protein
MPDEQKPKVEKAGGQVKELELNNETLQDLTEGEAEAAQGGYVVGGHIPPTVCCTVLQKCV